jgi:hypothetical protein
MLANLEGTNKHGGWVTAAQAATAAESPGSGDMAGSHRRVQAAANFEFGNNEGLVLDQAILPDFLIRLIRIGGRGGLGKYLNVVAVIHPGVAGKLNHLIFPTL